MEKKRRGRPPSVSNPHTAAADGAIALSAYYLLDCGFPGRTGNSGPGVFEVVGLEACRVLKRVDSYGRALGPDRIEQIFEDWFTSEQEARRRDRRWPLRERWRYTKESLSERAPRGMSLAEMAADLLRNNGQWKFPQSILPAGDLILSPSADRALGPRPRFHENGVEK